MQYEIFLEIVFLQYSAISFCALVSASAIRGIRVKMMRIALGSFVGGVLGCIGLIAVRILGSAGTLLFLFGTVLILPLITYPIVSACNYRKNCFAVVVSFFLVGGISIVLKNRLHIMKYVLLFMVVLILFTLMLVLVINKVKAKQSVFYPVTLYFNGEVRSVIALADSGNRIKDSKGRRVCVISQHVCPGVLEIDTEYEVRTLGSEEQQMKGGIVEKMVVHTREGNLNYDDVPIAIYPGLVSATGKFEMILQSNYCMRE